MTDNIDSCLYITFCFDSIQFFLDINKCRTTACYNAFFYSRTGCIQGIFNTEPLVLHFHFSCCTNFNDSHPAGHLGQTFLKLIFIKLGSCHFELLTDLFHTGCDSCFISRTTDNCCIIFCNANLVCCAKIFNRSAIQLTAHIFGNHLPAGKHSNIFQHGFAAVTKARSLDRSALECPAKPVDYECRQRFTFYVFRNNEKFFTCLYHFLQQLDNILNYRDLFIGNENVWIIHDTFHFISIGNHVRAEIPTVKLHTFHNFKACTHSFGIFYSNNTIITYFFHGISNQITNGRISRRNRGYLCDLSLRINGYGFLLNFSHKNIYCLFNTFFQNHRVCTGSYVPHTFMNHGLSQQCGSCRTVTGHVICLCCHFLHKLGTHIFKGIFQLNLTGDGYTVINDIRCAIFLVEDHITPLGSKSNLYCICQLINTF